MSRHFIRVRKDSFGLFIPTIDVSEMTLPFLASVSEMGVENSIENGYSKPEDWVELVPISVSERVETKTVEVKTCVVL